MVKKHLFILLFFSFICRFSTAQEIVHPSLVKWYTFEEAVKLAKTNPKPILLDVYTDWCSWCKFMMSTTFANKGIADYINNNFYAARFNAETFDTITYQGKKYFNRRIGSKPSHDLAAILLDGKLSYPSIVYFDREGNKLVIPGYKEAKDIEPILVYYAENVNKSSTLDDFYINFIFSFPKAYQDDHSIFKIDAKLKPDTLGKINWATPESLVKLQKSSPKPTIVYLYTDWSISSKVMERTTLRDRKVSEKINNNYHLIKINAASNDTIVLFGKQYIGTGENMPHQLTFELLNNNLQMPSLVFFDKQNNRIGTINGFWAKTQFLPLLDYFLGDSFKKMSFQDYFKSYKLINE